jgi:dipeptidyl aminopeptidase/acylaminoacyl peptidase
MVFHDEGHGFTKTENKITAYRAILHFLDRYLKGRS